MVSGPIAVSAGRSNILFSMSANAAVAIAAATSGSHSHLKLGARRARAAPAQRARMNKGSISQAWGTPPSAANTNRELLLFPTSFAGSLIGSSFFPSTTLLPQNRAPLAAKDFHPALFLHVARQHGYDPHP